MEIYVSRRQQLKGDEEVSAEEFEAKQRRHASICPNR